MDIKNKEKLMSLKNDLALARRRSGKLTVATSKPSKAQVESRKKSAPPKKKWIKKNCIICKSEFAILPDWNNPPNMCSGCRSERKEYMQAMKRAVKPKYPSQDKTIYKSSSVYQGGAPGLGKNK